MLEIKCPNCHQKSTIDEGKVPPIPVKVNCKNCGSRFQINKTINVNCRIVDSSSVYEEENWRVNLPACEGMDYDIAGVGGLIRSGLVKKTSGILPPGETQYISASDIVQLEKYFEQAEKAKGKG